MRILITGGAGFLGVHLCKALLSKGNEVVAVDNFVTSSRDPVKQLVAYPGFTFIEGDVCANPPVEGEFGAIVHLACPASPSDYLQFPLETLATGSHGSEFVIQAAKKNSCRVLLASTSEVYGDPLQTPQHEEYWGNVNPVGPRSVYDESKRYAEALFMAHRRTEKTNTGIARIFNTYGPGLRLDDGRVVSRFIGQALRGQPLTVYGDGSQTRSFCYVSDLVEGLVRMVESDEPGPVNLGNPDEISIASLARTILTLTGSSSPLEFLPALEDDPANRKPDISRAKSLLGWEPVVSLNEGLALTIGWQRDLYLRTGSHPHPSPIFSSCSNTAAALRLA